MYTGGDNRSSNQANFAPVARHENCLECLEVARDGQAQSPIDSGGESLSEQLRPLPTSLRDPGAAASDRVSVIAVHAAGAIREISTPLGYALTHIAHLEREIERQQRERSHCIESLVGSLREVRLGVEQARDIIRDTLQTSEQKHERPTPHLRRIILSCVKMARLELEQSARVVLELDAIPPVWGSETRLRQIFYHLLSNAFWAVSQADGEPVIAIKGRQNGRFATIDVEDSGPGIVSGDSERIFEPFFTTRGTHELAGLGLTICRRLAEELGGRVQVRSTGSRGATFRVVLPIAEDPAPETCRAVPAHSSFQTAAPPVRRLQLSELRSDGTT